MDKITTWHDRCIIPGQEFENQIDLYFSQADIILLLISSDFIASDYCYQVEMTNALERHNRGEAVVIPVILRVTNEGMAEHLWDLFFEPIKRQSR